jgi:ribonuclease HI
VTPPDTADLPDLTICFDGASRGNPGPAAIGVVVLKDGVPVHEIAEAIGETTNNVAEYRALLRGLEEASRRGARTLRVCSDSELVVRQLSGQYKVRSAHLAPLHRTALAQMRAFDRVTVVHVPRAQNAGADALANQALDAAAARDRASRRPHRPLR